MLYKEMSGRLGNQLFQYAAMRAFKERYQLSDTIVLNFSKLGGTGFVDDLANFNVLKYQSVSSRPQLHLTQSAIIKYIGFSNRFLQLVYRSDRRQYNVSFRDFCLRHARYFMRHGVYAINQGFMKFDQPRQRRLYFMGDFESSRFFNDIRPIILEEFTPRFPEIRDNRVLYRQIRTEESVCVTIRRGDFVENPDIKRHHYVCTPSYFMKGIEEVRARINNPSFIVFSDDIGWVRNNMSFPKGTVFENGNDPVWEKLRLMYSCKHFVISNSTFSWWAQYLSRNPKKLVVAPKRWKNSYQNSDIYDSKWVLVDTDKMEES